VGFSKGLVKPIEGHKCCAWSFVLKIIPSIDAAIWKIAPGFRALSLDVQLAPAFAIRNLSAVQTVLVRAIEDVTAKKPAWADAHLVAWADVFRSFGAKPQRTPCSAQGLRDRVLKTGTLSGIDPVVDLYNAVSLQFAVPVGGENAGAYVGRPRLVVADGSEVFDTVKNGEPATDHPAAGEVVWRDDVGVTCRIWNWRQGVRTRLNGSATHMWFVLESLPEMPIEALHEAGDMLLTGLKSMFGETQSSVTLLQRE
jgi:DNA/RNA-binding domain of Phe-tRNA-synthetase-like protein